MSLSNLTLSEQEKYIYLRCITYIMHIKGQDVNEMSKKRLMIESQMQDLDLPFEALAAIKSTDNIEDIIKELRSVTNVKNKRYIIREMILLAIVGHELEDEDISIIYQIATQAGVKEEKIGDFFLWAAKGVEWQIAGAKLIEEDI